MEYTLRQKQIPGYTQLVSQRRHLLRWKQGTGKTVCVVKAMYDTSRRCVLIICPSNAIHVWETHIKEWYEGLDAACGKDTSYNIHMVRWKFNDANKRRVTFASFDRGADVNIYITTAGAFLRDFDILAIHSFDCIIVDEAKRLGLTNRKSKFYERLKPFCRDLPKEGCFWPLTGTPGHTPDVFWPIFNLFDPKTFSSFWKFMESYCYMIKNPWGQTEILGLKKEAQEGWYRLLHAKTSALTKEELGHQETQRQLLYVEMDPSQERLYKQFQYEMYAEVGEDIILAQTAMTQTIRYRQILICPKIIDPEATYGAAFSDFLEQLEADPHVVLFTPYTKAIPHFVQGLREAGYSNVITLSGEEGLLPDELRSRLELFRSTKGICICSILFATAFSLEPAQACYFIGYDYDPDNNEQAEERLNRLTTPHLVNAYYYCYSGTYDETMCTNVNVRRMKANVTLDMVRK